MKVLAVCTSGKAGVKRNVGQAIAISHKGLKGDVHAKGGPRQISLLGKSSIDSMRKRRIDLKFGDFGENIVVDDLNVGDIAIGASIEIADVVLEVSKIGKECHEPCIIGKTIGDCIMPKEGVFATVETGGTISVGDEVRLL